LIGAPRTIAEKVLVGVSEDYQQRRFAGIAPEGDAVFERLDRVTTNGAASWRFAFWFFAN
jgi:hypothetical protein